MRSHLYLWRGARAGMLVVLSQLRAETELAKTITEMVKGGKIIPAHIYIAMFKKAITQFKPGTCCLLDGFPRSLDSLQMFEESLETTCRRALILDVNDERMQERLGARVDATGRADDAPEAVSRKIRAFKTQVPPPPPP